MSPETVKLAVVQMHVTDQLEDNVSRAIAHVRDAAAQGAQVILLPELFENLYFCQVERRTISGWRTRWMTTPSSGASRNWPRNSAWCCP